MQIGVDDGVAGVETYRLLPHSGATLAHVPLLVKKYEELHVMQRLLPMVEQVTQLGSGPVNMRQKHNTNYVEKSFCQRVAQVSSSINNIGDKQV